MPRFRVEYNAYHVNNTWRDDRVEIIEAPDEASIPALIFELESSRPDQLKTIDVRIKSVTPCEAKSHSLKFRKRS